MSADRKEKNEAICMLCITAIHKRVCINVKYVDKLIQLPELYEIPDSKYYVAGMLNYDREMIVTCDLAMLMGLDRAEHYSSKNQVVICQAGENKIALIFDDVAWLEPVSIEEIQQIKKENNTDIYQSICHRTGGAAIILDVEQIVKNELADYSGSQGTSNRKLRRRDG